MKFTLLLTATFLFAAAANAQTSANSQSKAQNASEINVNKAEANASGNMSTTAEIKTDAVKETVATTKAKKQLAKQKAKAAKKKVAEKKDAAMETADQETSKEIAVTSGSEATVTTNGQTTNNTINTELGISNQTNVSSAAILADAGQVKPAVTKSVKKVKTKGKASVQKVESVKPVPSANIKSNVKAGSVIKVL